MVFISAVRTHTILHAHTVCAHSVSRDGYVAQPGGNTGEQ